MTAVALLKKAILSELKLDAAPQHVRLALEVKGGAPVPLDSCEKLADQGVLEGSRVVVEVPTPKAAPSQTGELLFLGDDPTAQPHSKYWGA